MSLITSVCPLKLSSTGSGGTFFKTPAGMLIFSSSASSHNAAHYRCLALTLIKGAKRNGLQQLYKKE